MFYNPDFYIAWKGKKKGAIHKLSIYSCILQEQYFASTWTAFNIIPLYIKKSKVKRLPWLYKLRKNLYV